jgi:hypothetical protein
MSLALPKSIAAYTVSRGISSCRIIMPQLLEALRRRLDIGGQQMHVGTGDDQDAVLRIASTQIGATPLETPGTRVTYSVLTP